MRHVRLSRKARQAFLRHAGQVADALALVEELVAVGDWDVEAPAVLLQRRLPDSRSQTRREAVAALALSFPARRPDLALPESMRALYRLSFERLAAWFDSDADYDDDSFAKDVRLVAGLSAPAGAQDLDIGVSRGTRAALGRMRRALANSVRLGLQGDAGGLMRFLASRPAAPWVQIHTDSRWLDDFHEAGWDACYGRIAEFLALNPRYAGMVGQSWFYDPAVAEISPRLAYLQARPLGHGAIQVRLKGSALDVERATATSETRRALYERGAFSPRCWAIFWPQNALLAWAETQSKVTLREAA